MILNTTEIDMSVHAFSDRRDLEQYVGQRLMEIEQAVTAAQGDKALFPTGLTPPMTRALSFARAAAPPLMAQHEPETPERVVERLCRAIDAERDRRTALDFIYDFGTTSARDDNGQEIEAGIRHLQMRPEDRANWQTLQGAALTAVVSGQTTAILPMRAEDNWNIQTTASEVLGVLGAMTTHGAALLFAGGALKSQQRAIYPEVVDVSTGWPT